MPKRNFDDESALFEPIELTIEGQVYVIKKLTPEAMSNSVNISKEETNPYLSLVKQFCELTGAEFDTINKKVDVRKLSAAVTFICESFLNSATGKKKQLNTEAK